MAILDANIVIVALPQIRTDLRAGPEAYQWILDAYTICLCVFALSAGTLADQYGRKKVLLFSVGLFAAGSAVCASASGVAVLVAGRFLQGTAAAALASSALSLLIAAFPPGGGRTRALTWWSTSAALATVVGPSAGGFLVDQLGWQSIFWVNLPICALILLLGARALDESRNTADGAPDPVGQVLVIAWLAALVYALIEGGRAGWTAPPILGAFGVAVVLFAAFVVVERRHDNPMVPVSLLRNRTFGGAGAVAFVIGVAPISAYVFVPLFLQSVQGFSAGETGLLVIPMAVGNVLGSQLSGRWIARSGPRPPACGSLAIAGAALLALSFVRPDSPSTILMAPLFFLGIGLGMALPANNNAAFHAIDSARSGAAAGLLNALRQSGYAVGIALHGTIIAAVASHRLATELTARDVPPQVVESAGEAALSGRDVVDRLPATGLSPEILVDVATRAFATGFHMIMTIAGVLCLGAAVLAAATAPAGDTDAITRP